MQLEDESGCTPSGYEGEVNDQPRTQVAISYNEYLQFLLFKEKQNGQTSPKHQQNHQHPENIHNNSSNESSNLDSSHSHVITMTKEEKSKHSEFIKIKQQCHGLVTENKGSFNTYLNEIAILKRLIQFLEINNLTLQNKYSSMMIDFENTELLCAKQWKMNKKEGLANIMDDQIDCVSLMEEQIKSFEKLDNLVETYHRQLNQTLSNLHNQSVEFGENLGSSHSKTNVVINARCGGG